MVSRTYDEQRFSPLDQINKANVGQLRLAWARGLPAGTQESTPIVYRGVMYLFAPGATHPGGRCDQRRSDLGICAQLSARRRAARRRARRASRSTQDMIYFAAPDGFLVAIDAQTGKQRWETKLDNGGQQAGGILVADGKVISNRTCEQAKRENCFIAANDAQDRASWSGNSSPPPRRANRAATPGATCRSISAPPAPGGRSAPTIRSARCCIGASPIPIPIRGSTRHGAADAVSLTAPADLFSNSTVALDVETGKLNWYYQELPGDDWDADHNHERILIHTRVSPDPKHVQMDQSRHQAGQRARHRADRGRRRRHVRASSRRPANSSGRGRSPTTIPTST